MGSPQSSANANHDQHGCRRSEDDGPGTKNDMPEQPPAPPNPEDDTGIVAAAAKSPNSEGQDLSPERIDIFTLKPVSALKLLCRSVDLLVRMTGDVPPTPPVRTPTKSRSLAQHHPQYPGTPERNVADSSADGNSQEQTPNHDVIDGVPFKKTPIGSPESNPWEMNSPPHEDVGYNAQPLYVQHAALARKFYSKRPPPISTEDYLLRMHKYCPMSTAVYLATSCYITRLAVVERILPVTPRNVHRLLLAGLRVAMKALEDSAWPHGRFAKVGGVSEAELGRLEITFCFLTGFVLKVDAKQLQTEAENLATVYHGRNHAILDSPNEDSTIRLELKLPENKFRNATPSAETRTPEKRKASSALPSRPALHVGTNATGSIEVMGQS